MSGYYIDKYCLGDKKTFSILLFFQNIMTALLYFYILYRARQKEKKILNQQRDRDLTYCVISVGLIRVVQIMLIIIIWQ